MESVPERRGLPRPSRHEVGRTPDFIEREERERSPRNVKCDAARSQRVPAAPRGKFESSSKCSWRPPISVTEMNLASARALDRPLESVLAQVDRYPH